MSLSRAYLDYNATAPLRRGARVAMTNALGLEGNASSVHAEGRRARGVVESAREKVASLLGARVAEVVFTSGGTEANNAVLVAGWDVVFVAALEHDSVLAPVAASARARGTKVVTVPVNGEGVAQVEAINELACGIDAPPERVLITLQMANNETGVIQPLADAVAVAKTLGFKLHSDAVQTAGRVPLDFAALGADFLTVSAHKLGGPQGAGALLIRGGDGLPVFIHGGGQERRRRGGTENVAALAGFGEAAAAARRELPAMPRLTALRDALERGVKSMTPEVVVIGAGTSRLANTSCIALPRHLAETLVIKLDLLGVSVSAGSACSSGKVGASHVLAAMGVDEEVSESAIRVSLGWASSSEDVDAFLEAWRAVTGSNSNRRAVA